MLEWESSRRLEITNPTLFAREFHPRTAHRKAAVVQLFGSPTPHSKYLLFHRYHPPLLATGRPILLVPGANKDAYFFLDPDEDGRGRSLPEFLRRSGRQVYALTFAHNQDDNWWWCAAINRALEEIPEPSVDLLGHSKGGVAARLAATDWRPDPGCTQFLGSRLGRLVLVGAPNLGVDFFCRYPAMNTALYGPSQEPILNWPMTWSHIATDNGLVEVERLGYTGPYYPGQGQMLAPFDHLYPLPGKNPTESWTYHGGSGPEGRALGLRRLAHLCHSLIPDLLERPPEVEVALLAGTSPTIPLVANDLTGPGDGIVYLESALHCPESARVVAMEGVPVHHKALIAEPAAQNALLRALEAKNVLTTEQRHQKLQTALHQGWKALQEL